MGRAVSLRDDYDGQTLRELARHSKHANQSPPAFGLGGDLRWWQKERCGPYWRRDATGCQGLGAPLQ